MTKGAIYGHFASKEDLMLTAMEAAPRPRLLDHAGRQVAAVAGARGGVQPFRLADEAGDEAEAGGGSSSSGPRCCAPRTRCSVTAPESRAGSKRWPTLVPTPIGLEPRLHGGPGLGYRPGDAGGAAIYKRLAPGVVTPEVFERAFLLLADLYQEQ